MIGYIDCRTTDIAITQIFYPIRHPPFRSSIAIGTLYAEVRRCQYGEKGYARRKENELYLIFININYLEIGMKIYFVIVSVKVHFNL